MHPFIKIVLFAKLNCPFIGNASQVISRSSQVHSSRVGGAKNEALMAIDSGAPSEPEAPSFAVHCRFVKKIVCRSPSLTELVASVSRELFVCVLTGVEAPSPTGLLALLGIGVPFQLLSLIKYLFLLKTLCRSFEQ